MKLTNLIILTMLVCCILALFQNALFGLAYTFAILPLLLMVKVYCRNLGKINQVMILILVVCMWAFYLMRPLFLFYTPNAFKYGYFSGDVGIHIEALLYIGFLNIITVSLAGLLFSKFLSIQSARLFKKERLEKVSFSILLIALVVMAIYFIFSVFGIGSRIFEIFTRFMELIAGVRLLMPLAMAVIVSKSNISILQKHKLCAIFVVVLYSAALMAQSSKSFIIEIILMYFFFLIVFSGNIQIRLRHFVVLSGTVVVAAISFPIATALRRLSGANRTDIGEILDRINIMTSNTSRSGMVDYTLDLVTRRFNGYDGMLVALQPRGSEHGHLFNLFNLLNNALASLVPGIQSSSLGFGVAVSEAFHNFKIEVSHAGGVGHYGMLRLIGEGSDVWSTINVVVFTLIWATLIVLACRIAVNPIIRFMLVGSLIMASALVLSGGNFDRVLKETITLLIQAMLLSLVIRRKDRPLQQSQFT